MVVVILERSRLARCRVLEEEGEACGEQDHRRIRQVAQVEGLWQVHPRSVITCMNLSLSLSLSSSEAAQQRFGGAKSISSDQYFGRSSSDSSSGDANLSRFSGATSISSDAYFGRNQQSSSRRGGGGGGGEFLVSMR